MRKLVACSLLATALCWNATAATGSPQLPVTVVLEYEHPQSGVSFSAMRNRLQATMQNVDVRIDLRKKSTLTRDSEFEYLLVFKMKGTCSMSAQVGEAPSRNEEVLAMSYTAGNEVLPFGEVQCDRVRESLQRVLGMGSRSQKDETLYGSALALVMAHEIYHMVANAKDHTHQGLTKEKLSARDLLNGDLPLSEAAREAIARSITKLKESPDGPKTRS